MQIARAALVGAIAAVAAALAGCGTTIESAPPPVVKDCREPNKLFGSFTAQATKVAWSGSSVRGAATLSITLSIENTTDEPAALTNSGSGILYTLGYVLKDEKDKAYAPSAATGAFAGAPVHEFIKAGTPKEGMLAFTVPRGRYTLTIQRNLSGQAPPQIPTNVPFVCTVTVVEPLRLRANKPTIPVRP